MHQPFGREEDCGIVDLACFVLVNTEYTLPNALAVMFVDEKKILLTALYRRWCFLRSDDLLIKRIIYIVRRGFHNYKHIFLNFVSMRSSMIFVISPLLSRLSF